MERGRKLGPVSLQAGTVFSLMWPVCASYLSAPYCTKGEPLVRVMPSEHGQFLCKKAKVLHLACRPTEARDAFEQVQSIAKEINAKEASELTKMIMEIAEFLGEKP